MDKGFSVCEMRAGSVKSLWEALLSILQGGGVASLRIRYPAPLPLTPKIELRVCGHVTGLVAGHVQSCKRDRGGFAAFGCRRNGEELL